MVDNQHKKITGYRDLSEEEIQLMNDIKQKGNELGELISELEELAKDSNLGIDLRWLNIGRTKTQLGFMALIRSIARPSTFV